MTKQENKKQLATLFLIHLIGIVLHFLIDEVCFIQCDCKWILELLIRSNCTIKKGNTARHLFPNTLTDCAIPNFTSEIKLG